MVEKFETLLKSGEIEDAELKELLKLRNRGKIDFKLIDIRELYEYKSRSICGTDYLYPVSKFHLHVKDFEKIKQYNIILYCRTGNRTGEVLRILKKMGFEKIAHLSKGIVDFSGETEIDAEEPR